MGLLRRQGGDIAIRVYTVPLPPVPQPPPDLLTESWQRDINGRCAVRQLGPGRAAGDMTERLTAAWPDPGPLDPVVFPPWGAA